MNYTEFITEIETEVRLKINSDFEVSVRQISKNNGTKLDGLTIADPALNIAPTIYLNPYYHRYLSGQSLEDICDDILCTYHSATPQRDFDLELVNNFEKVKGSIVFKIVNYEKNRNLLCNVPHKKFMDLALIFQIYLQDFSEEYATITIIDSLMKKWEVDVSTLYAHARVNTPMLLPYKFESFESLFKRLENKEIDLVGKTPMYLLTNQLKTNGASVLLYPNIMRRLANILNSDLLVIPSSIHELIIIPTFSPMVFEDINAIICEVNASSLKDEDILSDHSYYYSKEKDRLISN